MTRWYIDASAAAKLLVDEAESDALAGAIARDRPNLVASSVLETELRRLVHRYDDLTQSDATDLLDGVDLHEVPPSLFREAGLLGGATLRSLDALHVTTASSLDVDAVLCYDARMTQAARELGLVVISPGREPGDDPVEDSPS